MKYCNRLIIIINPINNLIAAKSIDVESRVEAFNIFLEFHNDNVDARYRINDPNIHKSIIIHILIHRISSQFIHQ